MPSLNPTGQDQFTLSADLILVGEQAASKEEVLSKLVERLRENGYVKDSFLPALLSREKSYPTGLQTKIVGVAIPHTDIGHVLKPTLAIATLANPVMFRAMDNPRQEIPVELIIVMAIKDSSMQLEALQKIMTVLQDENILTKICQSQQPKDILQALSAHFAITG